MRLFFRIIFTILFLFSLLLGAYAQSKQVIIGLDESISMSSSWDELNYTLQTIIALIDENDELIIVTGAASSVMNINTKNKAGEVSKWYSRQKNGKSGESLVIAEASRLIKNNQSKESLLILIGDGRWSATGPVCMELVNTIKSHKKRSKVIFFKIGDSSESGFEMDMKNALHSLDKNKIYTRYGDERALKENLNKLANIIVEGKDGNIKPDFNGGSIKFKTLFPLKKVLVLVQNANCSFTNINPGFDLKPPINITNLNVGGNLEARCYEIKATGGSVINLGKEIVLNCSNSSCCSSSNNIKIIPIVALDMLNEVEGNFIESNPVKRVYTLCDKETEITINSFLINKNGKKIKLSGLKDLKIKVNNGQNLKELTFSNDKASGVVPLVGSKTIVSVESSYDGYFQKKAEFTFVRKKCPLKLDVSLTGDFKNTDEANKTYELCASVNQVNFESSILDDNGQMKPFTDFKTVDIYIKVNGKKTALSKTGNKGIGTLELSSGETKAKLVLEVNGSAIFETGIYTFRHVRCKPEKDKTVLKIEPSPIMEFVKDGKCINDVKIRKADGTVIDHKKYTFEVTGVPSEFNVSIDASGESLDICFKKNSYFICDCFVRHGDFGGFIVATPIDENMIRVDKEWTFSLVQENSFFVRCKSCLIALLTLGILAWYIYGIWVKPRFHTSARFEIEEVDQTAIYAPPNKKPRKKLPTTFLNRYLVPYSAESNVIDGMKFKATRNKSTIYLVKESLSEKLSKNGEPVNPKSRKDLKIFRNNTLEHQKRQNITKIYTLKVK